MEKGILSLTEYFAEKYGKEIPPKRGDDFSKVMALVIGEFIKNERKKAKLTQEELAERLQAHKAYISKIENGKIDLKMSTFFKIFYFGIRNDLSIETNNIK